MQNIILGYINVDFSSGCTKMPWFMQVVSFRGLYFLCKTGNPKKYFLQLKVNCRTLSFTKRSKLPQISPSVLGDCESLSNKVVLIYIVNPAYKDVSCSELINVCNISFVLLCLNIQKLVWRDQRVTYFSQRGCMHQAFFI